MHKKVAQWLLGHWAFSSRPIDYGRAVQSYRRQLNGFDEHLCEPLDIQANASGVVNVWGPSDDLPIQSDIELSDISAWGESFDKGRFV